MKTHHLYENIKRFSILSFFLFCLSHRGVSADSQSVSETSKDAFASKPPAPEVITATSNAKQALEEAQPSVFSLPGTTNTPKEARASFEKSDWLEEKVDAVTETLQQQLFMPYHTNLVLQALKQVPDTEKMPATVEKISTALHQRLGATLKSVCSYDPHVLKTLANELAKTIQQHCTLQKRRCSSLTTEDIHYLTGNFYKVLQTIDIEQLIQF